MKIKSLTSLRKPLLAVQWDRSTIDYLLVDRRANHVHVRAAGTETWAGEDETKSPGSVIKQILDQQGCRRPEALIGLNRSQVDVIPLQLPPAAESELPVLVMNQVVRDAGELADGAIVDYVTLAVSGSDDKQVFAFVADGATLQAVEAECAVAGLKPGAILYRPLAAVSALRRMVPESPWVMVLVTVHDEDVDLSIVQGADLLYTRTARIGQAGDAAGLARQLAVEIRRSLAAASLAPNDENQHVYVFGALEEHQTLVEQLADELGLPVSLLDPLRRESKEGTAPERVGRLAPLLGMIYEHLDNKHPIDFCSPKQPPPPPNRWNSVLRVAALLLAVIAIGAYYVWDVRAQATEEVTSLRRSVKQVATQMDRLGRKHAVVQAIQTWEADGVNWLDEFYDLTRRFPNGDAAMVRRLSISAGRGATGVVDMSVQVRSPDVVTQLGDRLRDSYHEVRSQRVSEQKSSSAYPWQFDTRITLRRRNVAQYRQSVAASGVAPEASPEQAVTVSTDKK